MTYISNLLTQSKKFEIGTHLRGRDFNKKNKNRTSILSLTTTTKQQQQQQLQTTL